MVHRVVGLPSAKPQPLPENVLTERLQQLLVAVDASKLSGAGDSFSNEPFKAAMAFSALLSQLKRAHYAVENLHEAANFLENRLLAVADSLPFIVKAKQEGDG
jgi:hypothetical protein